MPVISRFYGIVIKMYYKQREHNPPHVHAIYGEYMGMFSLLTAEMFEGDIPMREQTLVKKFIEQNREKLKQMWETQAFEMLPAIE